MWDHFQILHHFMMRCTLPSVGGEFRWQNVSPIRAIIPLMNSIDCLCLLPKEETGKKQEDGKAAELAKKYRDRVGDRQDGASPDYQAEDLLSLASGCRAVALDLKSGMDAAERRRQMIQESKFFGGDMEHIQ
jgi:hypothetical protein